MTEQNEALAQDVDACSIESEVSAWFFALEKRPPWARYGKSGRSRGSYEDHPRWKPDGRA